MAKSERDSVMRIIHNSCPVPRSELDKSEQVPLTGVGAERKKRKVKSTREKGREEYIG